MMILMNFFCFCRNTPIENLGEPDLEGKLNIKVSYIENKRTSVRQWHRVLAKIFGDKLGLILLRVRDNESDQVTDTCGVIDLQQFYVMKSNYTKRKYVFKLTNSIPEDKPQTPTGSPAHKPTKTEFLIQTDDQASFDLWRSKLAKEARSPDENAVSPPN